MDNSSIIVKAQEANIVVKKYAKEVSLFREEASKEFKNIKNNVSEMGFHWKGEIYDSFKQNMNSHLVQMQKCIDGLDDLSNKLDVISAKFAEAIEAIKRSTGK